MELILILYFTYCNIFRIVSFPHVINIKYILIFCSDHQNLLCILFWYLNYSLFMVCHISLIIGSSVCGFYCSLFLMILFLSKLDNFVLSSGYYT